MEKVAFLNIYKLRKGVSIPEFKKSVEVLNNEYISKLKGYISFELMNDGDTWADKTVFESLEDAEAFAKSCEPNELAEKFYSFLNLSTCRSNMFKIEDSYKK